VTHHRLTSIQILLEQYPTSAELAASIIFLALQKGDLGPGRSALDLGCGTGMLALGCAIVNSDIVLALDCDQEAIGVAIQNAETLELPIEFITAKVNDKGYLSQEVANYQPSIVKRASRSKERGKHAQQRILTMDPNAPDGLPLLDNCVDTVVTNPPFGTKHNAGMDVRFLKAATRLARHAIYSFHKTSTREYLLKLIEKWGFQAQVVAELKFDIPATYKFHTHATKDVAVDLLRISKI
jgi:rRNA N6-adenosine-methyltransferase METTL5